MSCGDGGVSYQYVTHILANVTNNAGGEENRRSRRLQKTQRRMTAAGREELKRRLAYRATFKIRIRVAFEPPRSRMRNCIYIRYEQYKSLMKVDT